MFIMLSSLVLIKVSHGKKLDFMVTIVFWSAEIFAIGEIKSNFEAINKPTSYNLSTR